MSQQHILKASTASRAARANLRAGSPSATSGTREKAPTSARNGSDAASRLHVGIGARAWRAFLSGSLRAWLTDVLHEMRHRAGRSGERARRSLEQVDETCRDLERSHAETALLFRLAAATSNSDSPNEVFEPVFEGVRELLGAERASILLF